MKERLSEVRTKLYTLYNMCIICTVIMGAILCVCVCVCVAGYGGAGEQDGETGGGLEETGVRLPHYPSQTPGETKPAIIFVTTATTVHYSTVSLC